MARQLTTKDSKMALYDRLSDSDLELYYRLPTTQEQVAYDNALMTRTRNKIKTAVGETRMKYGKIIITGIGDDSFTIEKDGKLIPLHSRADSEHYDPRWKTHVADMAPDIISKFAFLVFEASVEQAGDDKPDNEKEDNPEPDEDPT